MKIIVGLGNPGKKYELTRHNIGFRVVDGLSDSALFTTKGKFSMKSEFQALIGEGFIDNEKIFLVKPQTFMNNSGEAVWKIIDYFNGDADNLMVISDDFNLPFGALRFRRTGSSGGHNGLKSVIEHLGHENFPRLRIGIGLAAELDAAAYVLQKFSPEEERETKNIINNAVEAISFYLKSGIDAAMNKYN